MISILELFAIGIGPSSSHTVGPMRAAYMFAQNLASTLPSTPPHSISCHLYGSLAATGKGHGTNTAVILGLMGNDPSIIDPKHSQKLLEQVKVEKKIHWHPQYAVTFSEKEHIVYHHNINLPQHPNGLHFTASSGTGKVLMEEIYYSVGGGFIATENELQTTQLETSVKPPYPFKSAADLMRLCDEHKTSIPEIMLANENCIRPEAETLTALDHIWKTMQECVRHGCATEGELPGGLKVQRRAHKIFKKLSTHSEAALSDPLSILDWVNLYALAVNEENAAGGRVVTAPTNGAAGIIPAVLHYATRFRHSPHGNQKAVHRFFLTAGAIAKLYKRNASISGADVGCQGEVGVACSMAAGALVDFLGGDHKQVENAAEIGMEHNLGLTCDPIGGLVQIPCIERNAMGAVKAINAARIAKSGDGTHFVPLDKVIKTMYETGKDMQDKYKETARGGLAVNVVEC
jgi:L-serine dehydratase